jgi:hypothetical protein
MVIEYAYDSEKEAVNHEKIMKNQGWNVYAKRNFFAKYYRSYSFQMKKGAVL